MEPKKVRNSQKSKDDILNSAEIEFAEKGLYGARVDQIADRAGINKRMIYEYFGNKENLYKVVLKKVYGRLGVLELNVLSSEMDSIEAVRKIIALYFKFLNDNPTYVQLILWENLNKGAYIKDIDFSDIKNPTFQMLREVIENGKKNGEFKKSIDGEQFILSLLTFTFSYFSNRFTLSKLLSVNLWDEVHLQKRIENVTDIFLTYLCNSTKK